MQATIGRLQPELTLLLDFLIFRYSVWEGRPLPGMSLMNLRFRNENSVTNIPRITKSNNNINGPNPSTNSTLPGTPLPSLIGGGHSGVDGPGLTTTQRSLYCLGSVFLKYLWVRTGQAVNSAHWGDNSSLLGSLQSRVWRGMKTAEMVYRAASLLNFLVFIKTGRYRSILERVLGARLVYAKPSAARAISYEYLNRQLVWAEVSEVLLFMLPLVNVAAVKRAVASVLPRLPAFPFSPESNRSSAGGNQQDRGGGRNLTIGGGARKIVEECGICGTLEVLTPYSADPCRHVFCYYCLRGHTAVDPGFLCPKCFVKVDAMQPAYVRIIQQTGARK